MPLIQILTLEGFAVFVPNARGSTGYGLSYTKRVDRDWGGQDRLDHVHAMTEVLPGTTAWTSARAGVVGRSYGGYMTLMLASRHPELWRAAVDMFGPYDLVHVLRADPGNVEAVLRPCPRRSGARPRLPRSSGRRRRRSQRSPRRCSSSRARTTRAWSSASRTISSRVCAALGKDVDYLVFEDEGHDVLKLGNRVRCYDTIVGFFSEHLA